MAFINGTSTPDTLNGTTSADYITGGAGNDTINGGDGNDSIVGSTGVDSMTGGAGADVFAFQAGHGGSAPQHDLITDFIVGTDKLWFPAGTPLEFQANSAGQFVHYGTNANDWVQLRGVQNATAAQLTGTTTTTPPPPSTTPTAGNDNLTGTANADTLNALAGNDTVNGGAGNDTITGGTGYDEVTGGAGADVFVFAPGDSIAARPHDAIMDFQVGTDRLQFASGTTISSNFNEPEGQWIGYRNAAGVEGWVQLRGVQNATAAELTGTATTTPPPSSGEFGPQVWGDEFNGTSLDRSNWPIIYGGDQLYWNGAFRWDSRMVSVGNGSLNIGLEKQPDGIWETSGISAAPQPSWGAPGFPFTYGKVEIRAKASQEVDGAGPCFLLWPASNDHWPPEVDILETPHGRGMFTNHWAGPNGEDTYETTQFDLDYSQWHVYGLEWTPNRLTMTVDGQVMKTYTDHIPSEPMVVGLQGHVGGPNDGWYGNANATGVNRVDISVDYVRVFPLNDTGTMGTQTLTGQQVEGQQTLAAEPTTQRGTGQQATVEGFGARPTDGLGDLFTINRFRGNDELYGYQPELDRILLSGFSPREVVMKEGEVNGREYIDIIAGGVAGTAPNATHVRVWDVANYSDIHFGLG